jgi:site-specific DNA-methyltransferase (adenine-specific)
VQKNQLYYGDNLGVLREHIKDESVDLIYLDPPFNSRQDYNVLFAEKDGTRSSSQIMAFEDTWEWNMDAEAAYQEIVERGGRVSDAMRAFRTLLGHSDMMAYHGAAPDRPSPSAQGHGGRSTCAVIQQQATT